MPRYSSRLYPRGLTGFSYSPAGGVGTVPTLGAPKPGYTWNPRTLHYDPVRKKGKYTLPGLGGGQGLLQDLIGRATTAKQETRADYDIPWEGLQELLEREPLTGMTEQEEALLRQQQNEMINRWGGTESERIARLPTGLGATSEAERELLDRVASKKAESARDIGIERLASEREAAGQAYTRESGTMEALAQLAVARQEGDVYGGADAGALISAVMSGDLSSEQIAAIRYALGISGDGGGDSVKGGPSAGSRFSGSVRRFG